MATFDIFFVVVVGLSTLFGLTRGLVAESLGLAAWGVAILALKFLFAPVSLWLRGTTGSAPLGDVAALILIVLLAVGLTRLFAMMLRDRVKDSGLGPVDRVMGAAFGLTRGVVLISLVYLGLAFMVSREAMPDWIVTARSFPIVDNTATALRQFIGALRSEDALTVEHLPYGHPPIDEFIDPGEAPSLPGGYTDEEQRELEKLLEKNQHQAVGI